MDEWNAIFYIGFVLEKDGAIIAFSEAFAERAELCEISIYDRCSSDCQIFKWFRTVYVSGI